MHVRPLALGPSLGQPCTWHLNRVDLWYNSTRMKRSQLVSRPFRERVQAFLQEAHPGRQGKRAVGADIAFSDDVPSVSVANDQLVYLRQLRTGKIHQADASRIWDIGGALTRLSGQRWLNPVVLLFASGHYGEVAEIFLRVRSSITDARMFVELALTLPGVLQPSRSDYANIGDDIATQEARRWEGPLGPSLSYERRVWSIDGPTYALFAKAWRARALPLPPYESLEATVGACRLIAEGALYSVSERDRQVSLVLVDCLDRSQPIGPAAGSHRR